MSLNHASYSAPRVKSENILNPPQDIYKAFLKSTTNTETQKNRYTAKKINSVPGTQKSSGRYYGGCLLQYYLARAFLCSISSL